MAEGRRLLPVVTKRFPYHHPVEGRRLLVVACKATEPSEGMLSRAATPGPPPLLRAGRSPKRGLRPRFRDRMRESRATAAARSTGVRRSAGKRYPPHLARSRWGR